MTGVIDGRRGSVHGGLVGRVFSGRLLATTVLIAPALLLFHGPAALAQAVAQAAPAGAVSFAIMPQSVDGALAAFSAATRIQVLTPGAVTQGVNSPGVSGSMSAREGLNRLLSGTGLAARFLNTETVTVERVAAGGAVQLDPVQIEGDRTTGGPGALPPAYAGGQVARGGRIGALGNQDAMDVPFSVTGYTAETIRNQQAETIADVLANDPAVRSGLGYGNFAESFVIRGFQLAGEDLSVDGLYGTAPRQIVATDMFERVEVLKGANAFLNGAAPSGSGIGGGVNLVPKRAEDEPLTRLTAGYAMDSRLGLSADVGRRFGENNQFGVRVNSAVRGGDTAIDDEKRTLKLGSLALDYRGEAARVTLDVGTQTQRVEQGRPVVYFGSLVPAVPSASQNYAQPWTYSRMRDTFGQIRAEYDILPTLTAYGAFGLRSMREDGDYGSPTVTRADGTGTVRRLTVPREDFTSTGQAGVRADLRTGPVRHQLNAGASALRTTNNNGFEFGTTSAINLYTMVGLPRPATTSASGMVGDLPKVSESVLRSLYASDTLSILEDRVMVTAGLRQQNIQVRGYNRANGARTSDYDESALTPVVGLVVKPVTELSLYANRIEGLSQGPTAPSTAANSGEIFAPYRSVQYEVGGKLDFGSFGGSLSLFQTTQPSGITDAATRIYSVSGKQRNRGIELMLYGEPVQGLRLLGGATFIDPKLTDTGSAATEGQDAVGVPRRLLNANVEWDLPFLPASFPTVTLTGRVIHTGAQYLNTANSLKIPSWTRFDVGARMVTDIQNRPVTVRAAVENVADKAYWASASGGYLTQGGPLTAKLSVSVDF
ncbi:TonB-dependent receptor [Azospirillum picis]|uniref:Iron complex outermembrane receptor protein n=1 Tax=Azospirillum picis TaxID=488438 RepID=A0ABU0MT97_9PROT|nr:TonB-dependent receptor [Azospirillum picis]MBP2302933.1 iron complex outermembrane receptor protein [Azospirillum picis]MDQ0536685.1 iron complex outermembrane receptor protein [Azospirillum picis]